jgi:hypothetical protein
MYIHSKSGPSEGRGITIYNAQCFPTDTARDVKLLFEHSTMNDQDDTDAKGYSSSPSRCPEYSGKLGMLCVRQDILACLNCATKARRAQ